MRNSLALMVAGVLTATAVSSGEPAQARDGWPAVPAELGSRRIGEEWVPSRCSDGPAFNLYHGAYYDAPPALYLGYAYRPFYRYTAYRLIPRTYFCADG
jgi:hypothetical protein